LEKFERLVFSRFMSEYDWLFPLAKKHRCSSILLEEIIRLVERSEYITSENARFSFSLAVENSGASLPPADLVVAPFHLTKPGRMADFKDIADGMNMCYRVDNNGLLHLVQIPMQYRKQNPDETMKELSAVIQTLTVYVGTTLARMYSEGVLVRTWRKGRWLQYPKAEFDEFVSAGYPIDLLSTVLAHCVKMSERSKGGIVIVQKGDTLESCESLRDIQFSECELCQTPESQFIGYAEMDGAIMLSVKGRILAVAQRLKCGEAGGAMGGTRHESASRYSAEHECIAFVISSDGPISIFSAGSLRQQFFAELKP
jgi:hypothetical protein